MASAAVMNQIMSEHEPLVATSAAGVLSLLEEEDDALQLHALQQLNNSVDELWFQISGSIASIESLYEDSAFSHRELAALVASKVSDHFSTSLSPPNKK
jgi:hypothetical protein